MAPGRSEMGKPSISAIPGVGSGGGGDDCPATVTLPSSSNACNDGGSSASPASLSAVRCTFGGATGDPGGADGIGPGPGAARTARMGEAASGAATDGAGVTDGVVAAGGGVGVVEGVAG